MQAFLLVAASAYLRRGEFDPLSASCYKAADSGESYRGLVDTTKSGRKCTKWTEVASVDVSDDEGTGNHAYCRNPAPTMSKPYCFPLDGAEKEECNIAACPEDNRDVHDEAEAVKTYVGSHDCECAEQLFGSTTTTADTSVPGALLTVRAALTHKVTMTQIKQFCHCA